MADMLCSVGALFFDYLGSSLVAFVFSRSLNSDSRPIRVPLTFRIGGSPDPDNLQSGGKDSARDDLDGGIKALIGLASWFMMFKSREWSGFG